MLVRKVSPEEFLAIITKKVDVYDSIEQLSTGFFRVLKNGKYGILTPAYEKVIPPQYEYVDMLENEVIICSAGKNHYQLFTPQGTALTRVFQNRLEAIAYGQLLQ